MHQVEFANKIVNILKLDNEVIGVAVAGSWLTNDLDEFSDLDLILVTAEKISSNKNKMLEMANRFGELLTGFTGEHVGEPRVLICLYNNPLLHVDIKFLTLEEFKVRIEQPIVLLDTDNQLQKIIKETSFSFPYPDFQWIEDRFWIWIHYALLKIGRGELIEALDFLSFIRMTVLGPLVHIKHNNLPRGVRKIETSISTNDVQEVIATIPSYSKASILVSLEKAVDLYKNLRCDLYAPNILLHQATEKKVMEYFEVIKLG